MSGHSSPHPMVTTTSAHSASPVPRRRGVRSPRSMPISRIASTTCGWTRSAGCVPADRVRCRRSAARVNSASLICDRPALWRQTKRTLAIPETVYYIDGCRSSAGAEAEATRRGDVLRGARPPRRRGRTGRASGDHRQGSRRPGPAAARRRAAQARRQGVRVRARAAVRHQPAHAVAPPQEAARRRDRRLRAPGAVGLLLRHPRRAEGAVRMAELSEIRETVRERYANAAKAVADTDQSGCGCGPGGCGGPGELTDKSGTHVFGSTLYDPGDAQAAPAAAVEASLGCGVPTAVADLHAGETVLDLGSGAGADVLISAQRVGHQGRAIGLDMTDEMLARARANASAAGVENVEFL